jgi:hypothetical protein
MGPCVRRDDADVIAATAIHHFVAADAGTHNHRE